MYKRYRFYSGVTHPVALATLSLAVAVNLTFPSGVQASAFQLKENSARSMGRAYAGLFTAGGDVSVVANSPAALSELKGTYFQADLSDINFSARFKKDSAKDPYGKPLTGGQGGDAGTTMPVPSLYYVTGLDNGVHLGASLTVPFGFKTQYEPKWVGRYHGIKSMFESLDATFSASCDVSDKVSLGGSLIAQRTRVELTSAINFNAVVKKIFMDKGSFFADPGKEADKRVPPGTDGSVSLKSSHNWAVGWQLGGYFRLNPDDRISLNYRSQISHKLKGPATFYVPDKAKKAIKEGKDFEWIRKDNAAFTNTKGTAKFTTPAVLSASYWHQMDKFGVGADVAWTKWSVFKTMTVKYDNPDQPDTVETKNWRDTFFVGVGGDYYLSDKLTLRGGLAYDQTPTSAKYRDVRVPDNNRRIVSVGVGYQPTDQLQINASFAHAFLSRARVAGLVSPTRDVLKGSYRDYGNVLALSAQYKF